MNFLAHLWLADRTGTSLAGSILGDIVRGADLSAYPADIAEGIRLHRRVDARTDRHPLIREARERFAPGARRYAGIVLDLAADHVLAQHWAEWHEASLEDFTARCGLAVADASDWFELGGARRPGASSFASLLRSYRIEAGMDQALRRVASRLRDPRGLMDSAPDWRQLSTLLQPRLRELLDDLTAAMRERQRPATP